MVNLYVCHTANMRIYTLLQNVVYAHFYYPATMRITHVCYIVCLYPIYHPVHTYTPHECFDTVLCVFTPPIPLFCVCVSVKLDPP